MRSLKLFLWEQANKREEAENEGDKVDNTVVASGSG